MPEVREEVRGQEGTEVREEVRGQEVSGVIQWGSKGLREGPDGVGGFPKHVASEPGSTWVFGRWRRSVRSMANAAQCGLWL